MSEESAYDELQWRDIPIGLLADMRDEWEARTRYGKLLYPLWVLESAVLGAFVLLLAAGAWYTRKLEGSDDREPLVEVYKDE